MIQEQATGLRAPKKPESRRLYNRLARRFGTTGKQKSTIWQRCLYLLFGLVASFPAQAQMLFSENLTMNIDSTKTIQGSLQPVLDFKTEYNPQNEMFVSGETKRIKLRKNETYLRK